MRLITFLLMACLAGTAGAQQWATSFTLTEIRPGIRVITGEGGFGGGNMGLLSGEDFVVLIDDGVTPLADLLAESVAEAAGRPVNFIVNTHVHGDHVGGNSHFADTGAVVFAHENIRARLLADASEAGGIGGLPVVTFAHGVTFHVNDQQARVFHVPGAHTDGDSAIHFIEADVLFTGDLQFHSLFPFIDFDNGGSVDGYIRAQEQLLAMIDDDTVVVPGHGEVTDRAGLAQDLAVLRDSLERVRALVDEGLDADAVVARNPLAPYHEQYNWDFITTERMTRTLVRSLTAGAAP